MREQQEPASDAPTILSTFTGSGGSCLGFRMAGYRVLAASEFIPAASNTYKTNFPDTPIFTEDFRELTPKKIYDRLQIGPGDIDVIEGSPPCASFSINGDRERLWGQIKKYSDSKQRTDDLLFEYARLVSEIQPKVFIAENVPAIGQGKARGFFNLTMRAFDAAGYRAQARVVNSQWLGVPQARKRMIFIGVRKDLERDPVFPTPLDYWYSVRDALRDVPGGEREDYRYGSDETAPQIISFTEKAKQGQTLGQVIYGRKGTHFNAYKLRWDRPSPTIIATGWHSATGLWHPDEQRRISVPEARRIHSYPDDFIFTGNYSQRMERVGRSVPPLMMRAVAQTVREKILKGTD